MKSYLAKIAMSAEHLIDALKPGTSDRHAYVEPYLGYADSGGVVLRGRVLALKAQLKKRPNANRWNNFRDMLALFNTDEMHGVRVQVDDVSAVSDEEGYFTLHLPDAEKTPGHDWQDWQADIEGYDNDTILPALLPAANADYGIISDIDDTLIRTDAWSLRRNLWNSMTGNAATRHVFPDAVSLVRELHAGINPVFYVSSSPWNLHAFLEEIFERAGLVRGPKFLRDLGIDENKFITGTHGDHKGRAIDTILAANPDIPFILMGDTGQHDAKVYYDAISRHEGRIRRVILRAPGPGVDAHDQRWIDAIKAADVPIDVGADYSDLLSGA